MATLHVRAGCCGPARLAPAAHLLARASSAAPVQPRVASRLRGQLFTLHRCATALMASSAGTTTHGTHAMAGSGGGGGAVREFEAAATQHRARTSALGQVADPQVNRWMTASSVLSERKARVRLFRGPPAQTLHAVSFSEYKQV
mgnify:CR=1 FL=1